MNKFTIKLMEQGLVFHHGCTMAEFFDHYDQEVPPGNARGYTLTEAGTMPCVWVEDIKDVPTIAHECLHVVFNISRQMNIILSEDSEEFFTYALDHFVKGILTKLKRYETTNRTKK